MKGPEKIALFVALCATASCSPKLLPTTTTQAKDSVRVEYRERLVRDTAYIEITKETERIITRDSLSHLENTYAESTAEIKDGMLRHELKSKPQKLAAPVAVQVRDTIIIRDKAEQISTTIYKEKELTKGQKRQIAGFWILLVAGIALITWKIYRAFKL